MNHEQDESGPAEMNAIEIAEYPQLGLIAWSIPGAKTLDPKTALALYERNWAYVDKQALVPKEKALIEQLALEYGNGCLFV